MADSIVVKVKYDAIIRRIRIPKSAHPSFDALEKKLRDILHFPQPAAIGMTYVDSDGDHITLADDGDFAEAVVDQGLNPLILYVKGLNGAMPTRSSSISSDQSKVDSQESPKVDAETPKAAPGTETTTGDEKTHNDLADMINQQFAEAMGELLGDMSGLENQINSAFNDSKFKEFLESAPAKLAEVLQSAARSGFHASFEPIFVPGQGPCQKPAQQTATSPSPASEGVKVDGVCCGNTIEKTCGQKEVVKVVHHGVQCDVCDMLPMIGTRFKSLVKADYDLCEKCFSEKGKEGKYKKIEQAVFSSPCPFHHQPRNMASASTPVGGFGCRPGLEGRPLPFGMAAKASAAFEKLSGLDARFVKDVNLFDGTELAPAAEVTKIWRLQNSGSAAWPQHTRLVHVGGHRLGAESSVPLEIGAEGVFGGKEIDVSVDLKLPQKPGRYVTHWRLAVPGGLQFGQRMWAMVQVVNPSEPSPQVAESIAASADSTEEKGESCSIVRQSAAAPVKDGGTVSTSASETDSPKSGTEATSVGEFSVLQLPAPVPAPAPAAVVAPAPAPADAAPAPTPAPAAVPVPISAPAPVEEKVTYPIVVPVAGPVPTAAPVSVEKFVVEVEDVPEDEEEFEEVLDKETVMVNQLVQMGFTDREVNVEVLKKEKMDLQRTLDGLVAASKWDEVLNELEEMGFSNRSKNLSLMFKYDGNAKAVVKTLVQQLGSV